MLSALKIVLPINVEVRLHTIKDVDAPTFTARLPDKHVVELSAFKQEGIVTEPVLLRTFLYHQELEAQKQYRDIIRHLM